MSVYVNFIILIPIVLFIILIINKKNQIKKYQEEIKQKENIISETKEDISEILANKQIKTTEKEEFLKKIEDQKTELNMCNSKDMNDTEARNATKLSVQQKLKECNDEIASLKSMTNSCTTYQNNIIDMMTKTVTSGEMAQETIYNIICGCESFKSSTFKYIIQVFPKKELLEKLVGRPLLQTASNGKLPEVAKYSMDLSDNYPSANYLKILPTFVSPDKNVNILDNLTCYFINYNDIINYRDLLELISYRPTQEEKAIYISDRLKELSDNNALESYSATTINDRIYVNINIFKEKVLGVPLMDLFTECLNIKNKCSQ